MCIEYDIEEPVFYLPVDYWNNSNNNGMKFLSNSHLLLLVCCCFAANALDTFTHAYCLISGLRLHVFSAHLFSTLGETSARDLMVN